MASRKYPSTPAKSVSNLNPSKVKAKPKEKVNDEMKSLMNHRHQAVYHKSAFSVSDLSNTSDHVATENDESTMCRICQSTDDSLENQQVTPCNCSGSLQYVHMQCLQRWRQTKKLSGADVSMCELCKQPYNVQLLGCTDVTPDRIMKMQEDLKQLVKSGIYLMLLMRSWKSDLQRAQLAVQPSPSETYPQRISLNMPSTVAGSNNLSCGNEVIESSSDDDNEDYVSRQALKEKTARLRRRQKRYQK